MHLYLHIPFCKQACHYCDFHFSTNLTLKDALVQALVKEISLQKDYLETKTLETIYFGGGTPSLLSANNLKLIFNQIEKYFSVAEVKEITIEANPDDVNLDAIAIWKSFGINRISLGIQTFDNDSLMQMNRAHSANEAIMALEMLQNADFNNISVDLIYARMNENSHEKLIYDLETLCAFNLPHISAYNLTIEEKTVFGNWLKKDKITPATEDFAAQQFELLVNTLENQGYEQYEISNFAKNRQYAIHNTSYWLNHQYLGIGPSAHSYNKINRQANISNNGLYIKSINENKIPSEIEELTVSDRANDYLMAGLRTIWGIDLKILKEIVGIIPLEFVSNIESFKASGDISQENDKIIISKKGRIISDYITSELFFD